MGSKKFMIIIVLLLVVLIGGVATLGYVVMKKPGGDKETANVSNADELNPKDINTIKFKDPITTNLERTETGKNSHMVQLNFSIGVDNTKKKDSKEISTLITEKEDIIKHNVISLISKRTYDDMMKSDAKEQFVSELLQKLQEEFNSNLIVSIYINDWKVI